MTEAPLMNSPEMRTETGEIKPQESQITSPEATPSEAPAEAGATPAIPERYDFAAPEGITLDNAAIEAATPIFKELGLDQAKAQKLVDFYSKQIDSINKSGLDAAEKMRTDWRAEVKADKEIGGKIPEVQATVAKAIDSLGADTAKALREAFDLTGAGDHPAVIKAVYKWAQQMNEGTHVSGAGPSKHGQSPTGQTTRPTPAAAMYPNLPS